MKALPALLAFTLSCSAHAYSGKELFDDCLAAEALYAQKKAADPYQSMRGGRCLAYIAGFSDGYAIGDFLADKVGVQLNAWCLPKEADTSYRMVRAVLAHLEKLPPNSPINTGQLVAGALAKTFPCGQ